jgi:uncharacterized protein (DUF305 family)
LKDVFGSMGRHRVGNVEVIVTHHEMAVTMARELLESEK